MEIWKTIAGAFGYVFEFRKSLIKALIVPIAAMVLIGFAHPLELGISGYIAISLLSLIMYTIIAVTTHRVILLGPSSIPEWGALKPTKRQFIFILYSIGMGLCLIPIGFLGLIPTVGSYIAFLAMAYLLGRFSLVFPAVATDQDWSFSDSWEATKKHQVLMLVVVIVFPIVMGIPEKFLSSFPYMQALVNVISSLTLVFVVAALSVAFKVIGESNNES